MKLNLVNDPIFTSKDLIHEIYKGNLDLISKSKIEYNTDIDYLSYIEFVTENNLNDWPVPTPYLGESRSVEDYDSYMQNRWYMPEEYKNFDIEGYIRSLCISTQEKDRVNDELELFKKYNMIPLLQFLKYLVDTMRENNVLWGVGRGSSVASYCLFLLGVHKINSIKYELDITEFLRSEKNNG